MEKHEPTEAERRAVEAANRIFAGLLSEVFPSGPARTSRNKFLYWETPDQRLYGYTPWKDSNGDYFTLVYKPVGKGSQSGKARRWKLIERVCARTRKTAKARAYKRYQRRMEVYHG